MEEEFDDIKVELVGGHKGIFDVVVDGTLLYSKAKTGRFPDPGEVIASIGGS